jgi:dihydrodipicolinate synthase/N-acetylneuraminate lyase
LSPADETGDWRQRLRDGLVIPAHPLALTSRRTLDERRQRALTRYYLAAGAGGLAVGVHTTQFAIRDPLVGLLEPVLALAAETMADAPPPAPVRIAGISGATVQATAEAALAARYGYHAGLVSLAALPDASIPELIAHVRAVADILPIFGFYLQPAVGGRVLPQEFWRRFCEVPEVVAIKIAPFSRYRTLDVVRAVAESGRAGEIALYTGNDDHIILDLLTPFRVAATDHPLHIVGGLLGQWAVWTRTAVELHAECRRAVATGAVPERLLVLAAQLTDANAAIFDATHAFKGCIPGIHHVLEIQGLLAGSWCLDPRETLSPGQREEIARVRLSYPHLTDDAFVAARLDEWLA